LFIDTPASHWVNKDVLEMSTVPTYGYDPFIKSIPYNKMQEGYPVIDKIVRVNSMTNSVNLGERVTESPLNPISVYQDGVEIGYLRIEPTATDTIIYLKRYVPQGSLLRVICHGRPMMKQYSNPNSPNYSPLGAPFDVDSEGVKLPNKALSYMNTYSGYSYRYDPSYSYFSEKASWNGTQLKRVPCVNSALDLPSEQPSLNSIYYVQDTESFHEWNVSTELFEQTFEPSEYLIYSVTPDEKFVTTFYLRNEVINFSYIVGLVSDGVSDSRTYKIVNESLYAESDKMIYTNRFFPDVFVSKSQIIAFLDRLRVHLLLTYSKYKDVSEITISDTEMHGSAFLDIRTLSGNPWWWPYLRNVENLKYHNGVYVLNYSTEGKPQSDDIPRSSYAMIGMLDSNGLDVPVSRGEAAYLLNRFRKYFLEVLC
jgi:hypothetical protein